MQKIIKNIPVKNLILSNTEKITNSLRRNLKLTTELSRPPKSQLPPQLNVFDRNAKRLQCNLTIGDPSFKDYEYVKSEVGFRVADRIFDIKRSFNSILDLGCQRGYVSKHLTKVKNKNFNNDLKMKILFLNSYSRKLQKKYSCLKWPKKFWYFYFVRREKKIFHTPKIILDKKLF